MTIYTDPPTTEVRPTSCWTLEVQISVAEPQLTCWKKQNHLTFKQGALTTLASQPYPINYKQIELVSMWLRGNNVSKNQHSV